jgi:hypothetical protein
MPLHQCIKGETQRLLVELTREANEDRNVVSGARAFELLDKPKPLLGEGRSDAQRTTLVRPGARPDALPRGRPSLQQQFE